MVTQKIKQHNIFGLWQQKLLLSTVKFSDTRFETALLYEDMDDMEMITSKSLDEALTAHNELLNKYTDMARNAHPLNILLDVQLAKFYKEIKI